MGTYLKTNDPLTRDPQNMRNLLVGTLATALIGGLTAPSWADNDSDVLTQLTESSGSLSIVLPSNPANLTPLHGGLNSFGRSQSLDDLGARPGTASAPGSSRDNTSVRARLGSPMGLGTAGRQSPLEQGTADAGGFLVELSSQPQPVSGSIRSSIGPQGGASTKFTTPEASR
jgi:hypothetical protein